MKAHFRTLLAASLLSLSSLGLRAQEAAPTPPEKKAIQMAGKHEISFNLRNLSFNEVNNSILGLAYRYHWNAKWNLRVQADVQLDLFQKADKPSNPALGSSAGSRATNISNYAGLVGVERSSSLGPGVFILGLSGGIGINNQDLIGFITSGGATIQSGRRLTGYRVRPSVAYRWQFHKNISATVETQLNVEYEAYDLFENGSSLERLTTYRLLVNSIPISSLTLNIHFK